VTQSMPNRGRIVRGPMATDHYTQLHNLAFRGAIDTRYVGVFGYIVSHQEGWSLTASSVATALSVGKDFVTSALHAIEAAHCLIRKRDRDAGGKVRGTIWFVTDLPLQLRQLGITDDAVVRDQVQAAYKQWRSTPMPENPTLVANCENVDPSERLPRSKPKSGFPAQVEPAQVEPLHKKNNNPKKNLVLEDLDLDQEEPPSSSVGSSAPAATSAGQPGRTEEEVKPEPNPEPQTSEQAAAAEVVVDGLPTIRGRKVSRVQRPRLVDAVGVKLAAGWSAVDLTAELTRDLATAAGAGVYWHRLAEMPVTPPPALTTPPSTPQAATRPAIAAHVWVEGPNGACRDCAASAVSPVHTRTPRPTARRCEHGRVIQACPSCREHATKPTESPVEDRNPAAAIPRQDARLSALLGAAAGSVRV